MFFPFFSTYGKKNAQNKCREKGLLSLIKSSFLVKAKPQVTVKAIAITKTSPPLPSGAGSEKNKRKKRKRKRKKKGKKGKGKGKKRKKRKKRKRKKKEKKEKKERISGGEDEVELGANSPRSENSDDDESNSSSFEERRGSSVVDESECETITDYELKRELIDSLCTKNGNTFVQKWPHEDVLQVALCYGKRGDETRSSLRFFAASCVLEMEFGCHHVSPKSKDILERKHVESMRRRIPSPRVAETLPVPPTDS